MNRREVIQALGCGAAAQAFYRGRAKAELVNYHDYSQCLPNFLSDLAAQAHARRKASLDKVTNAVNIEARQKWVRATFWKLIGGIPDRTPLHTRTTGTLQRNGYRLEKLVYESRPASWISANLYIPEHGTPPYPGVLFQMGHSLDGKAADSYQRCCQGLVKLGFAVLAFDPMGQGERTNYPGPDGLTRLESADAEHTIPGRQMLLLGDTATRMQVWDAVRSLDVLTAHPLVDPKRLASAGQSGGGTLTMMLVAVDDRLSAAVVCSGNTENVACANFLPPGSVDDAEQNLIGAGPIGIDRWDLLWPFAPKPLLIIASAKDSFGTYSPNYEADGLEEYARLRGTYEMLGQPEKLQRFESPLQHGLSYSLRIELYNWLRSWFQGEATRLSEEPEVTPETAKSLWATSTGSVVRDLRSLTPFAAMRARAVEIVTPPDAPDLRTILGLRSVTADAKMSVLGRAPLPKGEVLASEVATEPQVWVPMWVFVPRKPVERVLVILEPQGRNANAREGGLYEQLMEDSIVCAPDLRYVGDLRPAFSRGAPGYASERQSEENYSWASLIFGVSMLSQRVHDLMCVVYAVQRYFGTAKRVAIAAKEALTITALCTASLEKSVEALYLASHLVRWKDITQIEIPLHPFANYLSGVIGVTDLPNIAATISPRRIVLAGTVDAARKELAVAEVSRMYGGRGVTVHSHADWGQESLRTF